MHRGLTSQDVIDTALMLCLRDGLSRIRNELTAQVRTLVALTETHQHTPMLARTLTQAALPSTVGAKMATWLAGVLDAADAVAAIPTAAGAGRRCGRNHWPRATELTGSAGRRARAERRVRRRRSGSRAASPWHTTRSVITRVGDALVGCCDAWGRVATDVATGSRTEIGELAEGAAVARRPCRTRTIPCCRC